MTNKLQMCLRRVTPLTGGMALLMMTAWVHADTTINFHGTLLAGACEVDTLSSDQTVVLGDISTTLFNAPGDMSPARPFSISLTCPEGGAEHASVTFSGKVSSADASLLALDESADSASGVAVQIAESDGTKVSLDTPSAARPLVVGENVLNFTARYQALVERSVITPGVANATSQFTINYP
ncbi:type 1 fimbrial protein [Serratia marcescens]|uniref:fimbrial protein n=1 Tax=Serratia marcescens TaxID=615 RepID=UPI00223782E7|nr:fimbrial protein [Serratia marcescens]MCW6025653.1 type 1 fimbrial protein [Serratia marcescens]